LPEFRLSPAALRDMEKIFDHTARQWGMTQALRYTTVLDSACAALACAPDKGKDCSHIRRGYRRHSVGKHVIYYLKANYGIAVIRVLHSRMDEARHFGSRPP
jgi:toxin ParE1/3/4